jgi:hypothetical protein
MYTLPKFSTQPEDWAPLPEYDDVDYSGTYTDGMVSPYG